MTTPTAEGGKLLELALVITRTVFAAITMAYALVVLRGIIVGDLDHPIFGILIATSLAVTSFSALRAHAHTKGADNA